MRRRPRAASRRSGQPIQRSATTACRPQRSTSSAWGETTRPTRRFGDWDQPRFLFVASDWERKNGDAVVRTFARLRQRIPNARLDLVGNHPRVDSGGVIGHGWLSLAEEDHRRGLDRLFEIATCFVMPSWCEPSGIVHVEAAAAGIPSIGSAVGGSAHLIGDGGWVVDPADEQGLLDAMLRFADGETAREAGARALARADLFTWPEVARRILAALEQRPSPSRDLHTATAGPARQR